MASAMEPAAELHVGDVGIELDDLERDVIDQRGLNDRRVERVHQRLHLGFELLDMNWSELSTTRPSAGASCA
jgi:hypothetical protein